MCGFVGIHYSDSSRPVSREELARMLSTVSYRGPDGVDYYVDRGVGFGFCRLAIIDPEGGHQPLANEDRSIWIVFNGEIYNFRELTSELKAKGYQFRTRSDTETIVHAYEQWGESCVEHLRGIFAFSIWDCGARQMFLARDRSGIKPLHLSFQPEGLYFGSEAKALLASGHVPQKIDLIGYLGGEEVEPLLERTPFVGVRQLGAGCSLTIRDGVSRLRRYWEYVPSVSTERQECEALIEAFGSLLHETIGSQLVADVPVAASLSGGIDSAAVVASIVRHQRSDIKTYTVSFDQDHTEDLAHARIVTEALGIHSEEIRCPITRQTADLVPYIGWVAEGEFDLGYVARFHLAKAVYGDGAKVLLTGQGIDEILTGYYPSYADFRRRTLARNLRGTLHPSYRGLPAFAERVIDDAGEELSATADGWARLSAEQLKREHWRLGMGLLRFEDRMGMAAHVEVRVPYLDHRLLEFCAGISETSRQELFSQKSILRRAVAAWLPPVISARRKVGFNISALPLTKLLLSRGGDEAVLALLGRETTERKGYFDWSYCESLLRASDFFSLDHVLIIHLLDELFVSDFRPERYATAAPERIGVSIEHDAQLPIRTRARGEYVPRISASVTRLVAVYAVEPASSALGVPAAIDVEFAEALRSPVRIPLAALELIRCMDGKRTYEQLARELLQWPLARVLALGEELERAGVVEHGMVVRGEHATVHDRLTQL